MVYPAVFTQHTKYYVFLKWKYPSDFSLPEAKPFKDLTEGMYI